MGCNHFDAYSNFFISVSQSNWNKSVHRRSNLMAFLNSAWSIYHICDISLTHEWHHGYNLIVGGFAPRPGGFAPPLKVRHTYSLELAARNSSNDGCRSHIQFIPKRCNVIWVTMDFILIQFCALYLKKYAKCGGFAPHYPIMFLKIELHVQGTYLTNFFLI